MVRDLGISRGGAHQEEGADEDWSTPLRQQLEDFEGGQQYPSGGGDSSSDAEGTNNDVFSDCTCQNDDDASTFTDSSSDDFSSDGYADNSHKEVGSIGGDGDQYSSQSEGEDDVPNLSDLHKKSGGDTFEGGRQNLRFNTRAADSEYYPFETISHMLLCDLVFRYSLSRAQTRGLLSMLRTVDNGKRFDINDLERVTGDKFFSRMRKYMPLIEVIKRRVRGSSAAGAGSTVEVFDFPANLLLERQLLSARSMATYAANPGGKVMRGEEAEMNRLSSDHVLSGPVRPRGNERRTNMHGILARSSAFHGYDGVVGRDRDEKIHVNDAAMCLFDGGARYPCRVVSQFWDEEGGVLMASVRRFRGADEVHGESQRPRTHDGLRRVWEETDPQCEVDVRCTNLLALLNILTPDEVSAGLHRDQGRRAGGVRWPEWEPCVGEGFISQSKGRKRGRSSNSEAGGRYRVTKTPWTREGTPDQPLFTIRRDGFRHNVNNLPFVSAPLVMYVDAFNAHGMGNKVRNGGSGSVWSDRRTSCHPAEINL